VTATSPDTYFSRRGADPYRALKNPDAPTTREWVEAGRERPESP